MKGKYFKDKDIRVVSLGRGDYLVGDKFISLDKYDNEVEVDSFENIRPVTRTSIVDHYTNGTTTKSNTDYSEEHTRLLSHQTQLEYDETTWDSLESEFNFRKYVSEWKPVYREVETIGDPLRFDIEETVIETGCKFVTSTYVSGTGKNASLFTYDRHNALLSIVNDCFTSLGMEYKGNISYTDTKNKKVWGNSDHSCIRYVTAFGTYIFSDAYNSVNRDIGTLKNMLSAYNNDKKKLCDIIVGNYKEHFGEIDSNNFPFDKLLTELRACSNSLSRVSPKQSTSSDYSASRSRLNDAISLITSKYETNKSNV